MFFSTSKGIAAVLIALVLSCTACNKTSSGNAASAPQQQTNYPSGSLFAQAKQLRDTGKLGDAVDAYQRGLAESKGPHHPQAAYELALIQVELHDVHAAATAYQHAWIEAPQGKAKESLYLTFMQLLTLEKYLNNPASPDGDPRSRLDTARKMTTWLAGDRFQFNSDEAKDVSTGLVWRRCLVGQSMADGIACEGKPKLMRRDQARDIGEAGWRVPTAAELQTLVDNRGRAQPRLNRAVFPLENHRHYMHAWTSDGTERAQDFKYVTFSGAREVIGVDHNDSMKTVRLVKDGR